VIVLQAIAVEALETRDGIGVEAIEKRPARQAHVGVAPKRPRRDEQAAPCPLRMQGREVRHDAGMVSPADEGRAAEVETGAYPRDR
jgi:hypothetical protein